ncbi:MAG: potassium channel family protein, partial [Planctomycetota bacterium]
VAYWSEPGFEEFKELQTALYFSAATYTTLGYGDIVIEDEMWRLLAGLEAVNGMLLVGWSTAMLYFIVQRIWHAEHPLDPSDI